MAKITAKDWKASWTVWFNIVLIVIAGLGEMASRVSGIEGVPPAVVAVAGALIGLAGIVLRIKTYLPLK